MISIKELDKNKIDISKLSDLLTDIRTIKDENYAKKLYDKSNIYLAYDNNYIVGIVAGYINDFENKISYISYIGVLDKYRFNGIGQLLINKFILASSQKNMLNIRLEVDKSNIIALNFYIKNIFKFQSENKNSYYMIKKLT